MPNFQKFLPFAYCFASLRNNRRD